MNRLKILLLLLPVLIAAACAGNSGGHAAAPSEDNVDPIGVETVANDKLAMTDFGKIPEDWLLSPGGGAGKTRIHQDAEAVYAKLGTPDAGDAAMGKSVSIWYARHDSAAHSVSIFTTRDMGNNPKALVRQIRVTAPSFKTKDRIGPGSGLTDIKVHYEVHRSGNYTAHGHTYEVYSTAQGIAFETDEHAKCVAVIIFEAGKSLPATYLSLRPGQ